MATLTNQSDTILQATDYRFIDPVIALASYDSNALTTVIDPKFTKLTDVAALSPALVVLNSTMTNTIGTSASLPTPTQYYWEYSTTTNPNTWIALSPQPTYGVGYAVGTLQLTNTLFKTHVGTGNTGIYYRLTLKYASEDPVVGPATLVSYVAQANTAPTIELSKPTVFIPTTSSTVDFSSSTFDLNVRVGTTYLRYDASATPAVNTFKVGTGVVRVGTATIGAMTLADRDKATTNLVSANDTAVFANFSGATTTDFALLEYPVTIKDIDGNIISISIQQSLVKQKTGQDGASAASFTIVNSAPVFNKSTAGVISPSPLILTTQYLNITGTITYQWYLDNAAITGATSSNYTVPTTDYTSVTTNTYKCTISGTVNTVATSLSDEVTVPLLADGSSAIQVSNSNQNITFTAPNTGYAGVSFANGGSVIKAYIGTTALSYATIGANTFNCSIVNANVTVAAGTGTGTTFTVPAPTDITGETASTTVTVTIRNAAGVATTVTTVISYSLSRAGSAGTPGPVFAIVNSGPVLNKSAAGIFSPSSLILTTQYLYITGTPSYQWYKNTVAIAGATSNSYTVPTTDYSTLTSNTYKCTVTGTINGSTSSLSDEVTIPLLVDGSNAVQISNSNQNVTFSAQNTGYTGITFTNGGSVIKTYIGTSQLTYALSGANTFSCTIANTGVTVAAGTGTGTTFTIPAPTAMSADNASTLVTVTIRDAANVETTLTTSITYSLGRAGAAGTNGTRTAILEMYQWAVSAPTTFPSGTSTYTWATGQFVAPATTNSWTITPPAVVSGQTLWVCRTVYADSLSSTTTDITWSATTSYAAGASGVDGVNGTRTAFLEVYRWSAATPTTFPSGSSTYTWATGVFTAPATLNSWSLIPGASSAGFNLYATSVRYADTSTTATTSITWPSTGQVAYVVGAAGPAGADSTVAGPTGNSARRAYARVPAAEGNPTAVTVNTTGASVFPPSGSWGYAVTWSASDPTPASTDSLWQTDGILNNTTGVTVWSTPYLSSLKVGTLSAITVDAGALTAGSLTGLTVTGGTVRTAASGKRVELSGATNLLIVYNAAGTAIATLGGATSGLLNIASTVTLPAIYATSTNAGAIFGQGSIAGVEGAATAAGGYGVVGTTSTTTATGESAGVRGVATGNNISSHGVRGKHNVKLTAGLIGAGNGYNFYADGTPTGALDYGTFTGAHDTLILKNTTVTPGDILVDKQVIGKSGMSNVICESVLSTEPNQKAATGIFVTICGNIGGFFPNGINELDAWSINDIIDTYDYCGMNSLGEGQINVCGENGDIEIGDLIVTSSMLGKGMRQADDIVRNYTVAKAREAVTFNAPNEVKTIACIYLCG